MLVILKKKCKVVLAGELRDLRDYKIAKWAFKKPWENDICHWNKIYCSFSIT